MNKKSLIIFVAVALVSAAYCFYFFDGFPGSSDACDYAGMGRNIIQGKGFEINHVFPLALAFNPVLPQPNCMWAPAYPMLLALAFELLTIGDNTVLLVNVLLFWALVLVGYLLARNFSDSKTAFVALLFLGFSQYAYSIIIYGSPEILAALLFAFSIFILDNKSLHRLVLSAIAFGLAVLSRYQLLILLPVFLVFFEKSYKKLLIYSLVVLGVCWWWMIRNFAVFGNPFFTLQSYGEYSKGTGLYDNYYYTYKSLEPLSLFDVISRYPLLLLKKLAAGAPLFLGRLPNLLNIFTFFMVIWSYIFVRNDHRLGRLMKFVAWSMAVYIALCLLDGQHTRHLFIFVPLLSIIAAAGFHDFLARSGLSRKKYGYIIALAILIIPYKFPEQEIWLRDRKETFSAEKQVYRQVADIADGPIASDASSALWWYSGLSTVWLPADFNNLLKVDSLIDLQGVYLQESDWLAAFTPDQADSFKAVFSARHDFPDGSILYFKSR